MSAIISMQAGIPAMSSLQIAEITGKRHDHVLRDIDNMFDALERVSPEPGTPPEEDYNRSARKQYKYLKPSSIKTLLDFDKKPLRKSFESTHVNSQNGQHYRCYTLPKRECLILISGYDVVLRTAIIDRWHELESQQSFKIPQTLSEALRLSADLADKVSEQQAQLAIAAPKVAFHDAVTESNDVCQLAVAAQVAKLPFGRNTLFQKLRELGVLITGGDRHNLPKQEFIRRGLFTVNERKFEKPESGEPIITFTTYATQKGIAFIVEKFGRATA